MQLHNAKPATGSGPSWGKPQAEASQAKPEPDQPSPPHFGFASSFSYLRSSRAETELTIPALVGYLISDFIPFSPTPFLFTLSTWRHICQLIIDNCFGCCSRLTNRFKYILLERNKWVPTDWRLIIPLYDANLNEKWI